MKRSALRRFSSDEGGATAIEYALLVAMMSICLFAIMATGGAVDLMYGSLNDVSGAMEDPTETP